MQTHHSYLFFFLLSTICLPTILASASVPDASPAVGSRSEIPHVESNRRVQSLGRFSVREYNYLLRKNVTATLDHAKFLSFSRVVEAEQQVVAGIEYYLKVVAKYGKYSTTEKLFDAVVLVQPMLNKSKELLSFTPAP